MSKSLQFANRIREVLLNGTWIAATNFKDQLLQTTWQDAIRRPAGLNSIALLTFHINYYTAGLLHALRSGRLGISDKYSFDLPEIQSETEWAVMVEHFLSNGAQFADEVEQSGDPKLDEPFVDEKYGSYSRNLDAFIEHCYYHLGQIVLIRKLVAAGR